MALHRLTTITLGVPAVAPVAAYYEDFGLTPLGDGRFATVDGGEQLRLVEAPTRRLLELGLGAADPDDVARIARAVQQLGLPVEHGADHLVVSDPGTGVRVSVCVVAPMQPAPATASATNGPGRLDRATLRADAVQRAARVRPRKLGHVVLGSTDFPTSQRFFIEGLGFKVSDTIDGLAAFMRCTTDHHNVLVQAAPVPFLHHSSWQVEDVDEVGRGAHALLSRDPSRHVWGLGRHHIGSNFFWYLKDPAGNFTEYYADMDCILDDQLWKPASFDGMQGLYHWGPPVPPSFLSPDDLAELMAGRTAERPVVSAAYDVAIVGYGPVGETLAILLGQRGWRVGVFEKQPQAYPLPRAVHFDHEIGRVLQACGVAAAIRGRTESADVYEWRNATGATLLRFESDAAGLSGWPNANMFAQPELERVLDARARALPSVTIARGTEVVDLADGADDVTLELRDADGAQRGARARFVVGCDGANSFVRAKLGSAVTDLGFFFDWLIVDVLPHAPTVWQPLNIQVCDPARPTTLVSGGPGRRRWEFMRLPGEDLDELNRAETAWRLLAPWDVTPANAALERHTVYRFQARWVDGWRRGRVLLAGDAAHQMPPFAGQGMCSGIRDAANLAWKLDLVLRELAPDALLDTYASERIPHVAGVIDFSMALGKVICIADPAEATARDAVMTGAIAAGQQTTPPPPLVIGPGVLRPGDPHTGKLFPQGRVRTADGREGLFDDVVQRGWVLLARDRDAAGLDAATRAWLGSIGGIVASVGADGTLGDLDGTYARWFTATDVAVVLQRPDFYVFGTAGAGGAADLCATLRAALSAP